MPPVRPLEPYESSVEEPSPPERALLLKESSLSLP
jgi:hypothetical protein